MTEDRSEAVPHPTVAELRKAEEAYERALQRLATTRRLRDQARNAHKAALMEAAIGKDPHIAIAETFGVVEGTVRKYRKGLGWERPSKGNGSDDHVG